jgi:hypothetical protein
MNTSKLWDATLDIIKTKVSKISYDTWFSDSKLHEIKDNKAIVIAPIDNVVLDISKIREIPGSPQFVYLQDFNMVQMDSRPQTKCITF